MRLLQIFVTAAGALFQVEAKLFVNISTYNGSKIQQPFSTLAIITCWGCSLSSVESKYVVGLVLHCYAC